jgi:hypothetical protein
MKILRAVTALPDSPTNRTHLPSDRGYKSFIRCLRWEFGFVCPLCLRHESEISGGRGVERLRLVSVEHIVARAADKSLANMISNCIFACLSCNCSRGVSPRVDTSGRRLLDPTKDSWGDHFDLDSDVLRPSTEDARYTAETYNINEDIKVNSRRDRRTEILDGVMEINRITERLVEVIAVLAAGNLTPEQRRVIWHGVNALKENRTGWKVKLRKYRLVPDDCPINCSCKQAHMLPRWLAHQHIERGDLD